jgi:biopolymer transport protein ExbB/TolQ
METLVIAAFIAIAGLVGQALLVARSLQISAERKELVQIVGGLRTLETLDADRARSVAKRLSASKHRPGRRAAALLERYSNEGSRAAVERLARELGDLDGEEVDLHFILPRLCAWAAPVFGFIGTVLGLSLAVGGFSNSLAAVSDVNEIRTAVLGITSGLGTAFDTTLWGLGAAMIVMVTMALVQRADERLRLDLANVVEDHVLPLIPLDSTHGNNVGPGIADTFGSSGQLVVLESIREGIDALAKTLLEGGLSVNGEVSTASALSDGEGRELREALEATVAAVRDTATLGSAFNRFAQLVEQLNRSVRVLATPRVFTLTESISPPQAPSPAHGDGRSTS